MLGLQNNFHFARRPQTKALWQMSRTIVGEYLNHSKLSFFYLIVVYSCLRLWMEMWKSKKKFQLKEVFSICILFIYSRKVALIVEASKSELESIPRIPFVPTWWKITFDLMSRIRFVPAWSSQKMYGHCPSFNAQIVKPVSIWHPTLISKKDSVANVAKSCW